MKNLDYLLTPSGRIFVVKNGKAADDEMDKIDTFIRNSPKRNFTSGMPCLLLTPEGVQYILVVPKDSYGNLEDDILV